MVSRGWRVAIAGAMLAAIPGVAQAVPVDGAGSPADEALAEYVEFIGYLDGCYEDATHTYEGMRRLPKVDHALAEDIRVTGVDVYDYGDGFVIPSREHPGFVHVWGPYAGDCGTPA